MYKLIKTAALAAAVLTALGFAGCTESTLPDATGEGSVRGINAVAGLADVTFLIEETPLGGGGLSYKDATATASYDNLSYTFNFDLAVPDAAPLRLASVDVDVGTDIDYTFVLAGDAAAQEMFVWERAERDWSDADTIFDINIGHVNTALGTVDVYFSAPGTMPVAGNAVGTVGYGDRLDALEFPAGDYEIVLTAANDPGTVLYQSNTTGFAAADSYQLVVFDADPDLTGTVSVRLVNQAGSTAELADARFAPTVQFINASLATGSIDVAINSDFTSLAVDDLPFAQVSGDIGVPSTATYQYANAGTTTVVLDEEASVASGSRNLFVLLGTPGDLSTLRVPSVRRGFSTVSRLRLINTVTNTDGIDIYLLQPGTMVDDALPSLIGVTSGFVALTSQRADDYELTVTATGSKTPLIGPTPVSLPLNDMVEIVILDTVDPNTADLLIFSNTR